ncbi:MAG: hypothetical protein DRN12_05280 [Thermoplasmata archaeon]|nr:MAG: hypothetical protein DRN12_05280 [Thermoplasmata archaeon]
MIGLISCLETNYRGIILSVLLDNKLTHFAAYRKKSKLGDFFATRSMQHYINRYHGGISSFLIFSKSGNFLNKSTTREPVIHYFSVKVGEKKQLKKIKFFGDFFAIFYVFLQKNSKKIFRSKKLSLFSGENFKFLGGAA